MRMPWDIPALEGWSIVGMNHYSQGRDRERNLFVAMSLGNICIKAEGSNEMAVFTDLGSIANKYNELMLKGVKR